MTNPLRYVTLRIIELQSLPKVRSFFRKLQRLIKFWNWFFLNLVQICIFEHGQFLLFLVKRVGLLYRLIRGRRIWTRHFINRLLKPLPWFRLLLLLLLLLLIDIDEILEVGFLKLQPHLQLGWHYVFFRFLISLDHGNVLRIFWDQSCLRCVPPWLNFLRNLSVIGFNLNNWVRVFDG